MNADIVHPLMRELELPYPVSVGRIEGGEWSSSVPDRVTFEGRLGVRLGESSRRPRPACARRWPATRWSWLFAAARFGSGETAPDDPFVELVREAFADSASGARAPIAGVPYGADMRLFCERSIPCVMAGTLGLREGARGRRIVALDDLLRLSRSIATVIEHFGRE